MATQLEATQHQQGHQIANLQARRGGINACVDHPGRTGEVRLKTKPIRHLRDQPAPVERAK